MVLRTSILVNPIDVGQPDIEQEHVWPVPPESLDCLPFRLRLRLRNNRYIRQIGGNSGDPPREKADDRRRSAL